MKIKLLFFLPTFLLCSVLASGQCSTCSDSNNMITDNGNGTFTATSAQEYYWEICEGNATISGSNTSQSVTVNSGGGYRIKVVRFSGGNCTEACEIISQCSLNDCPSSIGVNYIPSADYCTGLRLEVSVVNTCLNYINWNWDGSCCGISSGSNSSTNNVFTLKKISYSSLPVIVSATVHYRNGITCPTITRNVQVNCP